MTTIETEITNARLAEKKLRYRFDTEKQAEWQRVSADARAEVERAVSRARANGLSINKIAAAYGTTTSKLHNGIF